MQRIAFAFIAFSLLFLTNCATSADNPLIEARGALQKGQGEKALELANRALSADAQDSAAYFIRGLAYALLSRHAAAVADFDRVIQKDPRAAEAYDQRGSEHFKLGHIAESLADFDQFLELQPAARAGHWRRGITCYYAGRFEDGRKQFESYQTVDANDVENAVWSFLCRAREVGIEKARSALLKIGQDRRIPMMKIYALYAGRAQPDDVLAAARAGKPSPEELQQRLFYAHLYLGLYCEAAGDKPGTLQHMTEAVEKFPNSQYMGDVARVHLGLLRKKSP
jgi:lipoprotein NlpI